MIIHYGNNAFEFQLKDGGALAGHLKLNDREKVLLASLVESESEDWYLDANGERRSTDDLFLLSPWSVETARGSVKLLNRILDLDTGEVMFSMPDTYGEEFFLSYLRVRP